MSGDSGHFPLVHAKVHYNLVDVQALATLVQTYTSKSTQPEQAVYIFPLPPDASVCSFKAVINGQRTIKGIVKDKVQAKAEYNEAVAQGKAAALFEESNVEIFRVSIGNIQPQETIDIHISFACVISHNGDLDSLRLTFPSTIAPRHGMPPDLILDYTSRIKPWTHDIFREFTCALDFSVSAQMTSYVKTVTSPSHPIQMTIGQASDDPAVDFDPFKVWVTLSSPTLLDKDIVIILTCQGLDKPRCTVESFTLEEGNIEYTDAYALTLVPRFEVPPLPTQEYIFLVDRSGSMRGGKIAAVKSALQIMLRSLPPRGTSFNIISFGSSYSLLWPGSVPYTSESVQAASTHVDQIDSNMGGTEIRAAIQAAFRSRGDPAIPTTIFILTDGQAYDLAGVQNTIAEDISNAHNAGSLLRLFCMGIGNSVSKAMCDLIARAGRGTAVYVGEQEKHDRKLMGLLSAARGAAVENISIDWGVPEAPSGDDFEMINVEETQLTVPYENLPPISLFNENALPPTNENTSLGPETIPVDLLPPPHIQQAPAAKALPPLYPGFRTSIFAIVRRDASGTSEPAPISVSIKGTVLGRLVQLEVPVTQVLPPQTSGTHRIKMLHVLAARAMIQRFEDEAKGSFKSATQKAEIRRMAERYGIVSSETSFVAIDEQGTLVDVANEVVSSEVWNNLNPPIMRRTQLSYRKKGFRSSPEVGSSSHVDKNPRGGTGKLFAEVPIRARPVMHARPEKETERERESKACRRSNISRRVCDVGSSYYLATGSALMTLQPEASTEPTEVSTPSIEVFARAQAFEGAFIPSPILYQILVDSPSPPEVPALLSSSHQSSPNVPNEIDQLWCTFLSVAYLECKFSEEKGVWTFMVEKAMAWLEERLEVSFGKEKVEGIRDALKEEAARKYLKM